MRRKHNAIPKLHIKKDDTVKVISGDSKGQTGRVLEIYPAERRALVEGVNKITRHTKPNAQHPEGGRIEKEAKIDLSKLMLMAGGQPTRVGRREENGKLVRYAKRTGDLIKS